MHFSSLALALSLCFSPLCAFAQEAPSVPFSFAGGHYLKVSVRVADSVDADFIVDTGLGMNLVSENLARRLNYVPTRSYSGSRMSGQKLTVPIAKVDSLQLGALRQENIEAGVWDVRSLFPRSPEFEGVEGCLSLRFFQTHPFTIDYVNHRLVLESEATLAKRRSAGKTVSVKVVDDQSTTLTAWLSLDVPAEGNGWQFGDRHGGGMGGGRHRGGGRGRQEPEVKNSWVEVDTGAGAWVLNSRFMKAYGVEEGSKEVRHEQGTDETGGSFDRYVTRLDRNLELKAGGNLKQAHPEVVFQKILLSDGQVGEDFLQLFNVTFDIDHGQMTFAKPASP